LLLFLKLFLLMWLLAAIFVAEVFQLFLFPHIKKYNFDVASMYQKKNIVS
jgi:hypothetical protein